MPGTPAWDELSTGMALYAGRAAVAGAAGAGGVKAQAGAVKPTAGRSGTGRKTKLDDAAAAKRRKAVLEVAKRLWAERSESDARIVAPYSKAPDRIIEFVLPKLGLTSEDVFFDLGCGDGRWLVPAAKKYGCRGVGLEIQPQAVSDARRKAEEFGVSHLVEIRPDDFFKVDYSSCTAAAVFLSKEGAEGLSKLLRTALKPGVPIVCLGFHLPGWVVEANYRKECGFPVYIYRAGSAPAL